MKPLVKLILSALLGAATITAAHARDYKMAMSWAYEASQAGYMVAADKGFYRDAGVGMTLDRGYGAADTLRRLVVGNIDFAVADAALMIDAMAKDPQSPMIFVANIFQTSHYGALYVKNRNIKTFEDVRTAKFGDTGGSIGLMYPTFVNYAMKQMGKPPVTLNRIKLDAALGYPALFSGDVDIVASSVMQMAYIDPRAKDAGLELGRFEFPDYGFDPYTYGLAVRRDFADKNPDAVKAAVAASLKGWAYTCDHPKEALASLLQHANSPPDLAPRELDITMAHLTNAATDAHGLGYMDPAHWQQTRDLSILGFNLNEAATPPGTSFYDAKYMPAEPVMAHCGK